MKKTIKITGFLLILLVVLILIAGLIFPNEYHFERSITIQAPKEIIWKNISTFNNFQKWRSWDNDRVMQQAINGIDGTVGAVYSWQGNKEVGSGSLTYHSFKPMEYVAIDARFKKPYASTARIAHVIRDEPNNFEVTWSFDSEMPYPLNAITRLFMNPDNYMSADVTRSLQKLKELCESEAATPTADASLLQ